MIIIIITFQHAPLTVWERQVGEFTVERLFKRRFRGESQPPPIVCDIDSTRECRLVQRER